MQDCAARPSYSSSFSSPSPLSHIHFHLILWFFFFVAQGAILSPFSVVFPFLLIYSSLAPVFYILYLFFAPFSGSICLFGIFFYINFHFPSLISSLLPLLLCSPLLASLLVSGVPFFPYILSPSAALPFTPFYIPYITSPSIFLSLAPLFPPLSPCLFLLSASVSGHKPHTWLIDFWKQLADARPMYGPADLHSEDPEAHKCFYTCIRGGICGVRWIFRRRRND